MMPLLKLNTEQFYQAILAGCHALVSQRSALNEINVFPVADADTGDNMSSTARSIIEFSLVKPSIKACMESIADASILGARGNSGIIFSQFLNCLAKYLPTQKVLNFDEFSAALQASSHEMYSLIANPLKGTMLTIMESWAAFATQKKDHPAFHQAMFEILPLLKDQVEETKNTLDALKEAQVVDSGALGFYYFVQGFSEYIQHPEKTFVYHDGVHSLQIEHEHPIIAGVHPEHRYCTEAILKADSIEKSKLLSFLNEQGDCALVTGNERICRFHVHTNRPKDVFSKLINDYTVQYPKVDDMLRQFQTQHERKYDIALVTDSGADLPPELLDKYQIHQIPLNIHLGDHQLLDRHAFDSDEFYHKLKEFPTYPKTSYPNPSLIQEKLTQLAHAYRHVLIISLSGAMSGTCQAFKTAAQHHSNVTVIDSKTSSGAHGLILDYAGQLIASGLDLANIIESVKKAIKNTFLFVVVNEFESMIRSGRISKFAGLIAQFSKIKPIISIDPEGKGVIFSKCLSVQAAVKKLISTVQEKIQQANLHLADYCIIHADSRAQADDLATVTTASFNKAPSYIEPASLVIGLHAGQGCVALAVRMSEAN